MLKGFAEGRHLTFRKVSTLALLLSIALTLASAAQDHDVPVSVDGIRCDSCGSECSAMCGSRNFRTCCYNYIKKRSIPWQSTATGSGDNSDDEGQDGKSSNSDMKTSAANSNPGKAPLLHVKQSSGSGSHIFGGYIPEMIATGGASIEDGEILFPLRFRDLMASMVRTLNAFENKKFARMNIGF